MDLKLSPEPEFHEWIKAYRETKTPFFVKAQYGILTLYSGRTHQPVCAMRSCDGSMIALEGIP